MAKILIFVGTRPEAIKLAPIIQALREQPQAQLTVCATGQHREMLAHALADFSIQEDMSLDLMTDNQTLAGLNARLFTELDRVIDEIKPDWVLVQGDTNTVMVAAMVAFYHRVKVGHVEAGLRSGDRYHPFPEEINRKVTGLIATRHYAPTEQAQQNLLAEKVEPKDVLITGNTVVDALQQIVARVLVQTPQLPAVVEDALKKRPRLVLVTGHRRENFGQSFRDVCTAIRELAIRHTDANFVYPVHLNPNVQAPVREILGEVPGVVLCEPIDYSQIVYLMNRAEVILTDSGGIQEEGVSLGKQVLVTREVTERPEGLESGLMKIVGVDPEVIKRAVDAALLNPLSVENMESPYGDGRAAQRIVNDLLSYEG